MACLSTLLCLGVFAEVNAHMNLVSPPSWHDPDGSVALGRGAQCRAGCTGGRAPGQLQKVQGCSCEWFTNNTYMVGEATIPDDSPLVTYPDPNPRWTRQEKHPWRAPGTASVHSPCGHDGGNPNGCPSGNPKGNGCAGGGYGHGPDARTLKGNTKPALWTAGSVVEAAWAITANHGGGYQYRLCPTPSAGYMKLTETCFQKMPLKFVGDTQWVQYGTDEKTRKGFIANRTSTGTFPKGSQWTKNPIPACKGYNGGASGGCHGPQFPPPLPGLYGNEGKDHEVLQFHIIDKLQIPQDIAPGKYVLSYRHDCEQTPQVWTTCADILVQGKDTVLV